MRDIDISTLNAENYFALWTVCAFLGSLPAVRLPGPVVGYWAKGPGRWRYFWSLPTQLLVMPFLFYHALSSYDFSFDSWCNAWGQRPRWSFVQADAGTSDWVFVYLFPMWLLFDFLLTKVSPLMRAHHAVCLFGHLLGVIVWPAGFPWYMAGVTVLEVGSASSAIMSVWGRSRLAIGIYQIGMLLSNIAAVAASIAWAGVVKELPAQMITMSLTAGLSYLRQAEANKAIAFHLKLIHTTWLAWSPSPTA